MKLEFKEFKINIDDYGKSLIELVSQKLKIKALDIKDLIIEKESIDARNKNQIMIIYNLVIEIDEIVAGSLLKNKKITKYIDKTPKLEYPVWKEKYRPVIVGFGPAGMFAALYLTRCKAKPIIIERGSKMEDRILEVEDFIKNKKLNSNSNVQFGEGGAGTFSDGKLTTNSNNPLIGFILREFVNYGAPKEIIYQSMPHIGTDYLRVLIKNMREDLINNGAEFYFNTTFNDYEDHKEYLLVKTDRNLEFKTKHLLLGLGHSARDTIKMLYNKKIDMEAKSFSMGVRIEHKQEDINKIQYGKNYKLLPNATYKMAVHLKDRSVYTFCMCPGGEVVASQSEENSIVTNGMSYFMRDNVNSNAALLVNVDPVDYYVNSVLDGLFYQEKYEQLAFMFSKDYKAPINLVKEFMNFQIANQIRSVKPSYPHGYVFADFNKCLPEYVVNSLREALPLFDKKMPGFMNDDAVLTGIESRSSSPIRILRDENRKSNVKMIYPIGEGAGYAGGIITAAIDGLKTAISISLNG